MFPKVQEENTYEHAPTPSHEDEVETMVGPSVHVEGDFASEGNIVVKGMVSGSVTTSKLLTVEEGAKIFANVKAGDAVISGQIKGNLKIDNRLELTETAEILGDIWCEVLSIAPGAKLQGKINMNGLSLEGEKTKRRSMRTRAKAATVPVEEEEE